MSTDKMFLASDTTKGLPIFTGPVSGLQLATRLIAVMSRTERLSILFFVPIIAHLSIPEPDYFFFSVFAALYDLLLFTMARFSFSDVSHLVALHPVFVHFFRQHFVYDLSELSFGNFHFLFFRFFGFFFAFDFFTTAHDFEGVAELTRACAH